MSIITDKLDEKWSEKTTDENIFRVRAIIEDFYNNLTQAISEGQALYPTGDSTFDSYVAPIVQEMVSFKNTLDGYSEFIGWRQ